MKKLVIWAVVLGLIAGLALAKRASTDVPPYFCTGGMTIQVSDDDDPYARCARAGVSRQQAATTQRHLLAGVALVASTAATGLIAAAVRVRRHRETSLS